MQETIYQDFGKIIIRSPLYSYHHLFESDGKTADLDKIVLQLLEDPVFIEGIYWSSPQLHQTVLDFKNGRSSALKKSRLLMTLKKYALRASTRCTPYGIYAGCAITDLGSNTKPSVEISKRKVRVDVALLKQLITHIESVPEIWPHLQYHINNSLYPLPNQYRYLEATDEDGKLQYQVSSIERTVLLEEIIELSKTGPLCMEGILALMPPEVDDEEAKAFVKDLIATQFLTSELRLGLTIADELERLQQIFQRLIQRQIREVSPYAALLARLSAVLTQFEQLPLGVLPLKEITEIEMYLKELGLEVNQGHLFHADLKQPVIPGDYFRKAELKELDKALVILSRLSANQAVQETHVGRFKVLFKEKYASREIPLAEALDAEFGIGFPPGDGIGNSVHNSLTEQLDLLSRPAAKTAAGKCHPWLQHKAENLTPEVFEKGLFIKDKDLEGFTHKSGQLANQFAVMGTFLPFGDILLQSVGGAHANALLGRFGYMGEEMQNLCEKIADLEAERNKEVIFAEIIHIPDGRIGNIARRPVLSSYEIPYLASSTLDVQHQLPIEDLLISIQQDEIVLRSKKWDKRVIPRLSNAHNFTNSTVAVYKFLAAIQHQGTTGLEINWGLAAQTKTFLPRLSYGRMILHSACWFLRETQLNEITLSEAPLTALRSFFANWHVPRFVFFKEGDNELFIDTLNDSYLLLLLNEMKACKVVKLIEWLHGGTIDNNVKVSSRIQQFILPLSRRKPDAIPPVKRPLENQTVRRTFEPGSEWIYFKIYCSAYVSDEILLKVVSKEINLLLAAGLIGKAFFIRYTDPHYHIRLRLQLSENTSHAHYAVVMDRLYTRLHPLVTDGTVWKMQMDTYEREIERYGADEIVKTETLFFHDSILLLTCLADKNFAEDEELRFLAALKNIDAWLSLFDMSLPEKADFCERMSDAFAGEFPGKVKLQLDLQYRNRKHLVLPFLTSDEFDIPFKKRAVALKILSLKIENLSSYIHMSINRWFVSEQRLMEYMAYHFCKKYYNQLANHTNVGK